MNATCPELAEELLKRHDALCHHLLPRLEATPGQTDDERRQFIAGFLTLVAQAAEGNYALRDEYLETVIPGVKAVGMSLGYIISVLVHIFIELAVAVKSGEASVNFLADFSRDYTKQLVATWERS